MKRLLSNISTVTLGSLTSFGFISSCSNRKVVECTATDLYVPTYTLEDVSHHNSEDTGYWVSFGDAVYDVTNFIKRHSAGDYYIKLAAGGRIEPFWSIFGNHIRDPRAKHLLETYRIGNLAEKDQIRMQDPNFNYFDSQPNRDNVDTKFDVIGMLPFVAETKISLLQESLITPNDLFFVRNHFPVPVTTATEHELHIHLSDKMCSIGFDEMNVDWDDIKGDFTLKLNDLIGENGTNSKLFKPIEIICTTQCAGNRNHRYHESQSECPVIGYISTTKWKGILMQLI